MQLILAFLPHDQLEPVLTALERLHIHGLTISDAKGFGQEHDEIHPNDKHLVGPELTSKMRLELVCLDNESEQILQAIYSASHTGQRGNGKIFSLPVTDALRIKTGERGESAVSSNRPRPER